MSSKKQDISVRAKKQGTEFFIYEDYLPFVNRLKDGEYIVKIEPMGRGKDAMYAYYYSMIIPIGMLMLRNTGEEADEAHTDLVFKSLFAKKKVRNPLTGESETVLIDKRDMSYSRLHQYMDDVILFLEKCGYEVPKPEQSFRKPRNVEK